MTDLSVNEPFSPAGPARPVDDMLVLLYHVSGSSMDEERGALEDFGYELDEPVCEDGWGRVYKARYAPHDTSVLLRVFPGALLRPGGAWELMAAEVQAWARLDHPGIIRVLDWDRSSELCYCASLMPGGRPLSAFLSDDSGNPRWREIFAPLLSAVEGARSRGVLHLGLSTCNIWVEETVPAPGDGDAGGGAHRGAFRVRLGEFGFWYVAREFPELGIRGAAFPAPEQEAQGRASSASDVYTAGLLAVALERGMAAARACAAGGAPPAGSHPAVARCLETHPLARYRSAGELSVALGFPTGEPEWCDRLDCPMCRLKEQVLRERSGRGGQGVRGDRSRQDGQSGRPWTLPGAGRGPAAPAGCSWALVLTLLAMAALVWWVALR